jgi:glycosyltransferase involved in cell wall biosynthesis
LAVNPERPVRVLQSFPHRIGAARICTTAWYQAAGAAEAGADVLVMTGSVARPLPTEVRVRETLARGRARIPYRVLGRVRALKLHDRIVAAALPRLAGEIDIVHAWPLGSLATLRAARKLGIPTVLERPNAHTRFAYETVRAECERLGVSLPADHEHAYNEEILAREELEYALADGLLCPSDFVLKSFLDQGAPSERLVRHRYGYDETRFHPPAGPRATGQGLTALFVGVCAVRKGVHYALEAWLASPASATGRFLIAGEFLPDYAEALADMLAHPSVEVLGHRSDVPELMRSADALVLPSIEEGSALVCSEALASGCVPVVSDASGSVCEHGVNGLVHHVGDVDTLTAHLTALHEDAALLEELRDGCLRTAPEVTWSKAGARLVQAYREVLQMGPDPAPGHADALDESSWKRSPSPSVVGL